MTKQDITVRLRTFFKEPTQENFDNFQRDTKQYTTFHQTDAIYGGFLKEYKNFDGMLTLNDDIKIMEFLVNSKNPEFASILKYNSKKPVKKQNISEFQNVFNKIVMETGINIAHISGFGDIEGEYLIYSDRRFIDDINESYRFIKTNFMNAYRAFLGEINRVREEEDKTIYIQESLPKSDFMNYIEVLPTVFLTNEPSKGMNFQNFGHRHLNLWRNPALMDPVYVSKKLMNYSDETRAEMKDIWQAFLVHLSGGDPKGADYLLNTLSTHYNIKGTPFGMISFGGINGSAKSSIPKILNLIFTDDHYGTGSAKNNILKNSDNALLGTSLVYFFDEVKFSEDDYENVKNIIGNPKVALKILNANVTTVKNRCLIFQACNFGVGETPFFLKDGLTERRFTIFEHRTQLVDFAQHFEDPEKVEELCQINQSHEFATEDEFMCFVLTFAEMLGSYKYEVKRTVKPYETEIRKRMIVGGMNSLERFLIAFRDRDQIFFDEFEGETFSSQEYDKISGNITLRKTLGELMDGIESKGMHLLYKDIKPIMTGIFNVPSSENLLINDKLRRFGFETHHLVNKDQSKGQKYIVHKDQVLKNIPKVAALDKVMDKTLEINRPQVPPPPPILAGGQS